MPDLDTSAIGIDFDMIRRQAGDEVVSALQLLMQGQVKLENKQATIQGTLSAAQKPDDLLSYFLLFSVYD